ncbi:MAG: histidinol dehydrogenase [Dermabacter sp.]|nr:histidinol dehydrogenase [Dermabacter sp.]
MTAPTLCFATRDLRGADLSRSALRSALPRPLVNVAAALDQVRPVIEDVRERGAEAVREASLRFDGIAAPSLRVPPEVLQRALDGVDPAVRRALEVASARVRRVSEKSVPTGTTVQLAPGSVVRERIIPVDRVGLYVPGGRAPLPSSVVMNVVPAQVAGVRELVVASPPQREFGGYPHPTILAACALLGVQEVYAAGGAQAIALLAYGSRGPGADDRVEPVDLVTGPGNVYVAAAKRALAGVIGIDSEAGPTEIGIIADAGASPRFIAADLISQAEHDPNAASVLITPSEELVAAVVEELAAQAPHTEHAARVLEALGGPQSGAVLVDDLEAAITVANAYGAEHLEIHTEDAEQVARRITNAGAIFIGEHAPVSLGDYAAGSNHVLPTGGGSRFSSGLGPHSFVRHVHEIVYDREGLEAAREAAMTLSAAEHLPAHGRAIAVRFEA